MIDAGNDGKGSVAVAEFTTKHQQRLCSRILANGAQCRQWAMGNGLCRKHGGKVPAGLVDGGVKGYSKYLPRSLATRYLALEKDGPIGLDTDIRVIDARITQLYQLLGKDDSFDENLWQEMVRACQAVEEAVAKGDEGELAAAVYALGRTARKGRKRANIWQDIMKLWEEKRRMVDTYARVQERFRLTISLEQFMQIMVSLGGMIRETVTDRKQQLELTRQIASMIQLSRPVDDYMDAEFEEEGLDDDSAME